MFWYSFCIDVLYAPIEIGAAGHLNKNIRFVAFDIETEAPWIFVKSR